MNSLKSIALTVNHLVINGMAWCPVSNTGEQETTFGDQWHCMAVSNTDRFSPEIKVFIFYY